MSLRAGSKLGSYEVVAPIGAGGMGEVYRARDTNLRRDVAIKILPEVFASDPERRTRFEREAHVLASLNHPNIAHVYGLEAPDPEHPDVRALVMELVEGEDLSARIIRGPIEMGEALSIAGQIALALEAAHDAGIVHRDLKPANVKVRADGTVKVLDFGLAKAWQGDGPGSPNRRQGDGPGLRHQGPSPSVLTMTSPAMTAMGVILGTASYMSPEQARGRFVDKRADMWAFGVVLFEMLTGRALFPGETVTDVLALVVSREPDWTALPAGTPPPIRRLLRRCLEKDPSRRLRDAADARLEIDEARREAQESVDGVGVTPLTAARAQSLWRWPWVLVLAGLFFFVGVAGTAWLSHRRGADTALSILNLTVPAASAVSASLSPDGRWVAVVSDRKIFVKGMDEPVWRELAGTTGAVIPLIWSFDSRSIAFPLDSAIRKVDRIGSRPQTICERCVQTNSLRGGSWNADGVLLLGGSPEDAKLAGGLFKISTNGGTLERVTTLDTARGENSHRYPVFLPDGHQFVFTVRRDNGEHEIRIGDLSGAPTRIVASGFSKIAYAAGYLLFVREETLMGLVFDPASGVATGDPVKVAEHVSHNVGTGIASFAVAGDGTLVFGPAPATRGYGFLDRNGRKLADVTTRSSDAGGRLSRDGRRAVIAEIDSDKSSADIYVIDIATGARSRITSDPNWEQNPVWSPDNTRVAYRQGTAIFVQDIGGGKPQKVGEFSTGAAGFLHDWSADGKYLLLTRLSLTGGELVRLSLSGGTIEPIGPSSAEESGDARLSQDGRWVAYISGETGATEVHVRSFPDGKVTHRVTTTGGDAPLWSRDGHELFYRDGEGWVVACRVRISGPTIDIGSPERLFKPNVANSWGSGYQHEVDANGRFFVYRVGDETGSFANTLTVMLNWTKAIKR